MATLRDVARAAGVSPATASRALAQPQRVSRSRRALVERAAAELGYLPPERPEPTPAGHAIGLVVPDLENPFFAGIAKAFQRRAKAAGVSVLITDTDGDDLDLDLATDPVFAAHLRGVVLCSPRLSDDALRALPTDPPIVLVNRECPGLESVVIDNQDGMRQAVQHLHALGHRRIAYAGAYRGSWSDAQRRQGLAAAAQDLPGLETVELGQFPAVFAGGVAAADLVLASRATAVIAHNDLVALGLLDRLRARGAAVPAEVSVVGFDDIPAATYVSPALTTVAVPLQQLGRAAVDLLLRRRDHDADPAEHDSPDERTRTTPVPGTAPAPRAARTQRLAVSLVVRASTGPAPEPTPTGRTPA